MGIRKGFYPMYIHDDDACFNLSRKIVYWFGGKNLFFLPVWNLF